MNLLLVEMRRAMHRRLVRWMIALAVFGCAFMGFIAFITSGDLSPQDYADGHPAIMAKWFQAGTGDGMNGFTAGFLAIGAVICAASYAGAEWKAGTITTVLTWEPSRGKLHACRTASAAILSFVISFALQWVMVLAVLPAVLINGDSGGTDGEWWAGFVLAMLRVSLVTAFVAVLAMSIATIGRNTASALVIIAAWALVIEGVVRGLKPKLAEYLIGENVVTIVPWKQLENVEFDRSPAVSLANIAVYLGVIAFAAGWSFVRRDVVATS